LKIGGLLIVSAFPVLNTQSFGHNGRDPNMTRVRMANHNLERVVMKSGSLTLAMPVKTTKEKLSKIKSGAFSRGLALARVSVSAGARAASHAVGTIFASETQKTESFRAMLLAQMEFLTKELGQLKGSLMKVGQLISLYGEHFLPPEVNAVLKSLQNQSPPLEWNAIEKVIRRQLSQERLNELEIDPEPIASASLGQVHRAKRKSDGKWLAMKIQYPGVDQAIESDLKALRSILSVSKLIPKGPRYDELFKEVRYMLYQEVDYQRELEITQEFYKWLSDDPRYIVPEVIPEYSTKRILTTSLEEGVPVDSPEVKGLSQERRNALGVAFIQLYFREVFEFSAVQTDPHFGNYRVRLGEDGEADRLILFDFGAVRKLSKTFGDSYRQMVRGSFYHDSDLISEAASKLGFLRLEDTPEQRAHFMELCFLILEPFYIPGSAIAPADLPPELYNTDGHYLWSKSDLPKRVAKKGAEFILAFRLRTPPREVVFLDRKLGGVFIFLSVLDVRTDIREATEAYTALIPKFTSTDSEPPPTQEI